MPFYQRTWNVVLGDQAPPTPKNIRNTPAIENDPQQSSEELPEQPRQVTMDKAGLTQAQNLLSQQLQTLQDTPGATQIKEGGNFSNYKVSQDGVIFKGIHSEINMCVNPQLYGDVKMIVREFKPSAIISPDDLYLKILRRVGKDSPCIIATLDIFIDEKKHIFLFQELASLGNGMEWTKLGNQASEPQMLYWAQTIYGALDFIGGMGICHCSIHPKHILLNDGPDGFLTGKLSSFRDAIIYWDPATRDIIDMPCKPSQSLKQTFFRAPEIFGKDGEFFNPVEADVWSFGATMFYLISHTYPFNPAQVPEHGVDAEIRNTLAACNQLTDSAKYWLFGLMRTNTKNRTEFDVIPADPWFQGQSA